MAKNIMSKLLLYIISIGVTSSQYVCFYNLINVKIRLSYI